MGVKTFRSTEVLSFAQEYTCNHTALRRCRHHSVPIAALAHLTSRGGGCHSVQTDYRHEDVTCTVGPDAASFARHGHLYERVWPSA